MNKILSRLPNKNKLQQRKNYNELQQLRSKYQALQQEKIESVQNHPIQSENITLKCDIKRLEHDLSLSIRKPTDLAKQLNLAQNSAKKHKLIMLALTMLSTLLVTALLLTQFLHAS